MTDIYLHSDLFGASNIPPHLRAEVEQTILTAKFAATVESALTMTGGEPIPITLDRVHQLANQTHLIDPREIVAIVEEPAHDRKPCGEFNVRLATIDEIQAMNHLIALRGMGARRN